MKALELLESFGVLSSPPPTASTPPPTASTPSWPPTSPPIQKSVAQSQRLPIAPVTPARATKQPRRGEVGSKEAVPDEGDLCVLCLPHLPAWLPAAMGHACLPAAMPACPTSSQRVEVLPSRGGVGGRGGGALY